MNILSFQHILVLILFACITLFKQNNAKKSWLIKIQICTNIDYDSDNNTITTRFNHNYNETIISIKQCTRKFVSMLKYGIVLSQTFNLKNENISISNSIYYNHQLKELNLTSLQLKQIHENAINLTHLERLILKSNELNETTLNENAFATLANLKYLDLSYNRFEIIPDKLIKPLFQLEYLNLSHNLLKTFQFGPGFDFHFNFKYIDLSFNNHIKQINSYDFNKLRGNKIELLDLSNCKLLKDVISGVLAKFYHLKYYNLENNLNLTLQSIQSLLHIWSYKLEYLNLNNLNLHQVSSRTISLTNMLNKFERTIKELHLNNNGINLDKNREFFEKKIQNFQLLEILSLSSNSYLFNEFKNSNDAVLNLSLNLNLKQLHLSNVNLQSINQLVLNEKIEYLDLSRNRLNSLIQLPIDNYKRLKQFNISYNLFDNLTHLFNTSKYCQDNLTYNLSNDNNLNLTTTNAVSFLDISNNKNLGLSYDDLNCLFRKSKLNSIFMRNIKGIYCINNNTDYSIFGFSKSQIRRLNRLKCITEQSNSNKAI